ncbi:MAG: type II secretion system F family protein [Dehalococcoidia bacterium]|nr:MAG: type II secretion system F family protein [Dehalococcoidia bacterium]
MFALTIAFVVFAAVVLLVVGVVRPRASLAEIRIETLRRQVAAGDVSELVLPFSDRILRPTVQGFGKRLAKMLPANFMAGIQKTLIMGGISMAASTFITLWAVCTGFFVGLAILALTALGGVSFQGFLGLVVMGIIGFSLPTFWLRSAVRSRQRKIVKSLPDAMDLITTCVEAGLGLDAALTKVSDQMKGPLAKEISQTLMEVGMGRLRRDALSDLGQRTGVQELISFVNAVIQAEQLGVSIGHVLKVQSDQMRTHRRQRAEQLAHEAPIKMMFPLVLCIFPAFMLVILGPAVIRIGEQMMG